MNYYIKLENGNTVGHPVAEDNLITAFPSIDLQNLPPEWAKFERIAAPLLKIYEVFFRVFVFIFHAFNAYSNYALK